MAKIDRSLRIRKLVKDNPRRKQTPGATHEILCRLHTEFIGYPARSLSM